MSVDLTIDSEFACDLSIVVPARDEEPNVEPLVGAVGAAMAPLALSFELIVVDDGSRDRTRDVVLRLAKECDWLRCLALSGTSPGAGLGQSAALAAGYRAARGAFVASLDADLQNDPRDLPKLLAALERSGADLAQGNRSATRRDPIVRRFGSWVGYAFRRALLGDPVRDSACSLRVMRSAVARALPLDFAGFHRFVPALAAQQGFRVVEVPVQHQPRHAGTTKYGAGLGRALPGFVDLLAVRYLAGRRRPVRWEEIAP